MPAQPSRRELQDERRRVAQRYQHARTAERDYRRRLRSVAAHVGEIVSGLAPNGVVKNLGVLTAALNQYAQLMRPWAEAVSGLMIAEVDRRNEGAMIQHSRQMGAALEREIRKQATGATMRGLLQENVTLITSLPTQAAARVHKLTVEGLVSGRRAEDIAKEVQRSGEVCKSRADLIARTEVARTASLLTMARAQAIGSTHFIWRTAEDSDVRELHAEHNGKTFLWTEPPVAGTNGERAIAGAIYNCFTGPTLFGPIESCVKAFRGSYSGDLITLHVGETFFEATPNHPILTPRGWVGAGQLNVGDDILCVAPKGCDIRDHNVNNRYSTFGEIFEALGASAEAEIGSKFNFYGDTVGHKVDVVFPKQNLALNTKPGFFQRLCNRVVTGANSWVEGGFVKRRSAQVLQSCLTGLFDIGFLLFWGPLFRHQAVTIGNAANHAALGFDNKPDCGGGGLELLSQHRTAFAPSVELSDLGVRQIWAPLTNKVIRRKVVLRTVRHYSGPVYTAETDSGAYTITVVGVISKNCRCFPEPVLPDPNTF